MLKVLIVDDHPLFRKGLETLLRSHPNFEIVGVCTNGEDAIEQTKLVSPNVILMDLQMPGEGGIAAIRALRDYSPEVNVLVVTLFEDDDSIFMALRAGARGYIVKDADEEEILRAIIATGNGESIFSPAIASRVLNFFSSTNVSVKREVFPFLTEREREILHLIACGQSNTKIASELVISSKTVSNYVSNIFNKLQVADRSQAIVKAREAGLG